MYSMSRGSEYMIVLVIVEDDEIMVEYYKRIISEIKEELKEIDASVYYFRTGEELIKDRKLMKRLDILFLDNSLPGRQGLEVGRIVRDANTKAYIVFVSSIAEIVFDSFSLQPKDYLLKDKIQDTIVFKQKIKDLMMEVEQNMVDSAIIECNGVRGRYCVKVDSIYAFEKINRKIIIYTSTDKFTGYYKITELEKKYKKAGFLKISRSCLINMNYISSLGPEHVYMNNHLIFQMSLKMISEIKVNFRKFLVDSKK